MDDDSLLKIALLCSLSGILLLILISNSTEINEIKIGELTKEYINKEVKVSGKIIRVIDTPGLKIFDIQDNTGKITAVAFKDKSFNITKNDKITVEGKITEYKNQLEIEVNRILT